MNINQKDILKGLGFNISLEGTKYFLDIVEDITIEVLKGTTEEEIIKKVPSFCLEYYHFYYEVGKKTFDRELIEFHSNQHKNKKYGFNKSLYQEVYGDIKNPTLEQSALAISNYLIHQNILPAEETFITPPKVLKKK